MTVERHDPSLCFCGDPKGCFCPCKVCREREKAAESLGKMSALEDRLRKAGIDLDILADLIWMRAEHYIEERIETLARQAIKTQLKGIRLTATVWGVDTDS